MKNLLILLLLFPAVLLAQPETVNVGSSPNDNTGDPLRNAMIKLNTNDAAAFDSITDLRGDIGTGYTAGSGLTLDGFIFRLGSTLTEQTFVSNNGLYTLDLEGYSLLDAASARMRFDDDGSFRLNSYSNYTFNSSSFVSLFMWKDQMTIGYNGVVNSNYIDFDNAGITIFTDISGTGLVGGAYYGATAVDFSFVQKQYVDDTITALGIGQGVTPGMQDTINDLYDQVFNDTVDLAELVRLKTDTIPLIPWVKGEGLTGDSASFQVGGSMIIKWESSAGDTLVVDNFLGNIDAAAKSATILIQIDDTYAFSSPTTIMVATAITGASAAGTGQYITSFSSQDVPPDFYIKLSITALSANKPNQFLGQLNGHMKN